MYSSPDRIGQIARDHHHEMLPPPGSASYARSAAAPLPGSPLSPAA